MKYKLLILLTLGSVLFGQDSLINKINELKPGLGEKSTTDSLKFEIQYKLARLYKTVNFDSSIVYAYQALKTAETNNDYKQMIRSNLYIASIFADFSELFRALEYSTRSLKLAKMKNDSTLIYSSYKSIVYIYLWHSKDYDIAKIYLKKWLKLARSMNEPDKLARVHFDLGIYYVRTGNHSESEKYYLKALDYYKSINNQQNIANCLNNLGDLKEKMGELEEALEYNKKALEINQTIGDYRGQFINKFNIASIYAKMGKTDLFFSIMEEEQQNAEKEENNYRLMLIHELYYTYFKDSHQFEKALHHYQKYIDYSNAMQHNNKSLQMRRLEHKYLLDKVADQKKIYELRLQNKTSTLSFITVLLALSFFVLITIIIYFMKKRRIEELQINELKTKSELLALQYKINPHFLFNSLNSISQLVIKKSDDAEKMVQNLSDLLRYTLTFANKDMVPLEDELEAVRQYLEMERIRFQDRLTYTIHAEDEVFKYKIPPMVILPLVENSIKHGVSKLIENGEIYIKLALKQDKLMILVKDNGPQSEFETPVNKYQNTGFGHQSIIDRLKITYAGNFNFDIKTCDEEYCVKITIPTKK